MVRLRPLVSALAALLLLSPVVLPLASGLAASPHAGCACDADSCDCDHGAAMTSCGAPGGTFAGCGLQAAPCGPSARRSTAAPSMGEYTRPSASILSPPASASDRTATAISVPASVEIEVLEHPPESRA